ncbi:MAG: hypothetical protein WC806_06155 [Candidatus Gracilibacteria bacterium]|jgi:hypothetical protein
MKTIQEIFEKKDILPYLEKRNLLKQYKKAKDYLLKGNILQVKFKERNPKGSGIWYFKINRQYRALGVFDENGNLIIFKIDNHQ